MGMEKKTKEGNSTPGVPFPEYRGHPGRIITKVNFPLKPEWKVRIKRQKFEAEKLKTGVPTLEPLPQKKAPPNKPITG